MILTNPRPATPIVTVDQMRAHLRLDSPVSADDAAVLSDLVDAATEYAEQSLGASLVTRTITAVFAADEPHAGPAGRPFACLSPFARLYLPRGPVASVASVTAGDGQQLAAVYPGRDGTGDYVAFVGLVLKPPITVVYAAGYGPNVSDVPADVRMAVRMHAGVLFQQRANTDDDGKTAVPAGLATFYAGKRRTVCVA